MKAVVDREQLEKTQEFYGVEKKRPPLEKYFEGEKAIDMEFNPTLMNTIGHEFNHLVVAYKLGVPMGATTLTAIPQGDTLGQVNLPGHVDYSTIQIIATAGSVQAHDGQARGYGSDLYKAQLIELLGKGTSVEEARQKAESLISFYSKDVRMVCAKIIAYLQTEKNMAYIPGEMLHEIEERARYELKTRNVKINTPAFFKAPTPEEIAAKKQKEDTVGRPLDERTAMGLMEGNLYRVKYITEGNVENEVVICIICNGHDGHTADCEKLKQAFESDPAIEAKRKREIFNIYTSGNPSKKSKKIQLDLPLVDSTDSKYQN